MAVVLIAIEIIGTHQSPSPALGDSCVKSRKVDFMEGTVADLDIDLMAILLIIVQSEVLDTGGYAVALQSLNIGHYHRGGKIRILAQILEITASEGCAQDVHAWSKDHVLATVEGFLPKTATIMPGQRGIPGSGETGQCGKGHAGVVGLSGLFPFIPQHVGAHPVRAIIGPEVGETKTRNTARGELALGVDDMDLFL